MLLDFQILNLFYCNISILLSLPHIILNIPPRLSIILLAFIFFLFFQIFFLIFVQRILTIETQAISFFFTVNSTTLLAKVQERMCLCITATNLPIFCSNKISIHLLFSYNFNKCIITMYLIRSNNTTWPERVLRNALIPLKKNPLLLMREIAWYYVWRTSR